MAGPNIPARMLVAGTVHRVNTRTLQATDSLPARTVTDVVVLTDQGGFAEVAVDDKSESVTVPRSGERILWAVDVSVWNRKRQDGAGTFPVLYIKAVSAFEPAAAQTPAA